MAFSVFEELIANQFSQLAGLHVSGTLPLKDAMSNELLAALVQSWSGPPSAASSGSPATAAVLALVRKLEVRTSEGVIHVDFELGA